MGSCFLQCYLRLLHKSDNEQHLWHVLACALVVFPLCTSSSTGTPQLQMGGIFLAEHIHSMGGGCCASPQLNPFDMHGPEMRLQGCWSRWELAQCWDEPSPEVCQHLTPAVPTAHR